MSRGARRLVGFAVSIAPARLRTRYREEWNGDLDNAHEIGVPPRQVAQGAFRHASAARARDELQTTRPARLAAAVVIGVASVAVGFDLAAGSVNALVLASSLTICLLLLRRPPALDARQSVLGYATLAVTAGHVGVGALFGAWIAGPGAADEAARFSAAQYLANLLSPAFDLRLLAVQDLSWLGPIGWLTVLEIVTLSAALLAPVLFWTRLIIRLARAGRASQVTSAR